MPKIFRIAFRDARNTFKNVISLVVCVGMVVIPCFYAWFNIWGSWDPYSNTHNLRVALVNDDRGYQSDLIPVNVNLGDQVVSDLRASKSIGYVVVDRDEGIEGVKSGEYYAAIVIPEDFSADMLTAFSSPDARPEVDFYQNEKSNAIASIVTDKASAAVQNEINRSFASSLTGAAAGVLDQLGTYLESDDVQAVAAQLDHAIQQTEGRLSDTAGSLRSYAAIAGSTSQLMSQLNGVGTLGSALDASGMLRSGTDGVESLSAALQGATTSVNDTISGSLGDFHAVSDALDRAFDAADGHEAQLEQALGNAKGVADKRVGELQRLSSSLDDLSQKISSYAYAFPAGSPDRRAIEAVASDVARLAERTKTALSDAQTLSSGIASAITDLQDSRTTAHEAKTTLSGLVGAAQSSFDGISDTYEKGLRGSLVQLDQRLSDAAGKADAMRSQLEAVSGSLASTADSASKSLSGVQGSLDDAATTLSQAAERLGAVHTAIDGALRSGDIDQLRSILSSDAADLASFISAPVTMDRTPVFSVANNGSAMAPFYSTLAIWIGGVVLCALVKTSPADDYLKSIGATPTDAYIGRIIFFLVIGFMQSSLVLLGDLYFLGIQCVHPMLFLLCGWLESFIFINIIYALTASFGDVGKAIAVILMVIQVAGSGGTFPKEMLPGIFQKLYPFLPFVHGEDAMRACIAGIYHADYWFSMLRLAAFIVPALLLGLILRRPVIRLTHWMEHKLESTKLM